MLPNRTLILVYGRSPGADAVCAVADETEARTVLDLLQRPRAERLHYAEQLANYVRAEAPRPPFERRALPFRKGAGVFRLMPWRLAKWLSKALPAHDEWRAAACARIRAWLGQRDGCAVVTGEQRDSRGAQCGARTLH